MSHNAFQRHYQNTTEHLPVLMALIHSFCCASLDAIMYNVLVSSILYTTCNNTTYTHNITILQFKLVTLTSQALHTASCNISPQGPYAHPLIISYLFRNIYLDLVVSAFQPHGSGTPCLSAYTNPSHYLLLKAI